jgi:long-chain acyl-CoA synthetase
MTPTRLFEFIEYQRVTSPQPRAFGQKIADKWVYRSTDEIYQLSNELAAGLLAAGFSTGDRVASVVYKTSIDWVILDLALLFIGAIHVPMYPTISPREYNFILKDAGAIACFVGEGDLLQKVETARKDCPEFQSIFTFENTESAQSWHTLFIKKPNLTAIENIKKNIQSTDLATIIYTSGTTGNPKGVMLSHNNIVSNVLAVDKVMPINAGDSGLSFLPVCHVFERVCLYAYTYCCASVTFTGTDNLGGETGDLQTIKPHFFTTVPRLLEKVYEKIYAKGVDLTGIKRRLFFWALNLTDDFEYDRNYGFFKKIQLKIADKLIFSKWRAALGGRIKGILTGAAPCPVKIARVFSAAGIPVREGYGMTESSPGITINRFEKGYCKLGTVGPILEKNIFLKIDDSDKNYRAGEGEILCKGPNVMLGYFNLPEKTAETVEIINGERWLHTGDVGMLVEENGVQFLKITDRKKELLKTSGGKYVAPSPIESKLKENFLVEHAMIVGDNQKFVSALIVPAADPLKNWCEKQGIEWVSFQDAIGNKAVLARFQQIIDKINPEFAHHEQVKKFRLIAQNWEPVKSDGSDAELTPSLKLKRRIILQKFQPEISSIYN